MQDKAVYEQQREESDKTFPQGIEIILYGMGLDRKDGWWIDESTFEEDVKQATDLKLMNTLTGEPPIMVAYRMRTEKYIALYPSQITIRDGNIHNGKVEYQKLMSGEADVGLYGFQVNGVIVRWILINFHAYRLIHEFDEKTKTWRPKKHINFQRKNNTAPGDTSFTAYDMLSIKAHDDSLTNPARRIIIAHSEGYFEDIIVGPEKYNGMVPGLMPDVCMKDMNERIDRY